MATIRTKPTGSKAIQVVLADGARRAIGIGKPAKKEAESYCHYIGKLEAAALSGTGIEPATAKWVASTKPAVRKRLEELGLIEPAVDSEETDTVSVASLVQRYLAELDVKPRTVTRYRNQTVFMRNYFSECEEITGLTAGDGERFLKWLRRQKKKNGEPLSQNYVHKIVKTSRQVFAFAVANELMQVNPLASISVPEQVDEGRDFEITPEMTTKILDAANPKYRLIIALARYGGLRCPSELAGLRWSHFLWDQDRFIVHSPKTEHCGKDKRVVPIFAELLPYLLEAQELAPENDDRVFRDIDEDSNLRTETLRILTRAGITDEIPRFYQNCRSSRQTELEAEFPLHVVCKWLGNSERTARKHYLKVRESHFEQASRAGVFPSVQKMTARCSKGSQATEAGHEKTPGNEHSPAFRLWSEYTRRDSNPQPSVPKTDALSN